MALKAARQTLKVFREVASACEMFSRFAMQAEERGENDRVEYFRMMAERKSHEAFAIVRDEIYYHRFLAENGLAN